MESAETTQQIGSWTVRAVWTEAGPFPSELHITTDKPGAAGFGITNSVLREVKLIHPNPPETMSAMNAALDSLRIVRDFQSQEEYSLNDDYLKALVSAYVAMSNANVASPIEKMSYFLPCDPLAIEKDLNEAIKRGFIG
ncbi:hypothetical protein [Streptomyces sp. NBC_00728]|uniref:hypothetical protein n=1 Tax=Streptomyces sp. NBC_00728 TaxID=2903676 RepID=UPI00386E0F77